ncbi:growth/differentiation factor 8-like [Amphibalanus amphitrite]|uniref:growth/differentiation factor 8-like n=1 Tax=Amphibalanus amphitrite TaxID=1232801 RepID=UPI001C91EA88|nr:growth/differentiation factor 8-like [Amphibalanus amphitrite]
MAPSRRCLPAPPLLLAALLLALTPTVRAKVPRPVQADQGTSPASCQHCHVREAQKQLQVESIKAQILQKLGMEQAPNMTGRKLPVVSEALIQAYMQPRDDVAGDGSQHDQEFMAYESDDDHSQLEKMWTFSSRSPLAVGNGALAQDELRDQLLYFDLSPSITEMDLQNATLWLFVRKRHRDIKVKIHKLVSDERGNYIQKEAMRTYIKRRHGQASGYETIDVKNLVLDWFRDPQQNFGIRIETSSNGTTRGLSVNSFLDVDGDDIDLLPVLEVHVSSDRRRTKRTTGGNFCTDNSTETNCCRFPLVVDFHAFGWDWIIAPSSYHANYCSGNCPYVYLQKYPHTHIVQQVGGTSGPCCGPRKLSPIHMLYWDTFSHIRFDKLPNMIVDSCGCH